jgi:phosphatidylserine/phosphatidylglycerophosphate/cardiolipin synthase-like enzyme
MNLPTLGVVLVGVVGTIGDPGEAQAQQMRQSALAYYSGPETNLADIDRNILDQVGSGGGVNFAAFALTDYEAIDALRRSAERGARVRIYLDPRELEHLGTAENPFVRLARTRGVEIRIKESADELMHLKSYSVNGALLRTGSANESVSGLERQDNDLVLVEDRNAVAAFDRKFEQMWRRSSNKPFSYP